MGYGGKPELNEGSAFRSRIYDAMNAASALIWATRHGDPETVALAATELRNVAGSL
jgi:hypothetical protein